MEEENIPIDINSFKLADWLISRRIVPKNFQTNLKSIRNRITNALQDMSDDVNIFKHTAGNNVSYHQCQHIVNILKETEKGTKTIFGNYNSKRLNDWLEIIRLYEKDNIYLIESAQIYKHNISYEIAHLRKQITKLERQSDECLKRCQDLNRSETTYLTEYTNLLQQLDIKGENLLEEFLQALSKLPKLYAASINSIEGIDEAVKLYTQTSDCQSTTERLPITKHILQFGNTTVYEYVEKKPPLVIEEPKIELSLNEEYLNKSHSLNNGDEDYDLDLNSPADEDDDIDWNMDTLPDDSTADFDLAIEETEEKNGIAKGKLAYTLLDSPVHRECFINELSELELFLKCRLYELSQTDDGKATMLLMLVANDYAHDEKFLQKMLNNVENILKEIDSPTIRYLFQLKHSKKYANLLSSKLQQLLKSVKKIHLAKQALQDRSIKLNEERDSLRPILQKVQEQTKELKVFLQKDISKRYKNRTVNLLGGLN